MSGDSKLKSLEILNGIDRNVTSYQAKGKWIDGDKIRFFKGNPEKLGGWSKLAAGTSYRGIARKAITWAALNGDNFYGLGTHKGLFVYSGGDYYDITPLRATATETSCINIIASTINKFKVSDAAHGAIAGDYVALTSVSDAEIDIHGVYEVVSANTNNYVVSVNASTSLPNTIAQTKKGSSVTISYLLQTGKANNEPTTGYGSGTYGSGPYGQGTTGSLINNLRQWSFDTWGEDLMALLRGGNVYRWDKSDGLGTRASVASSLIPTMSNIVLVTEEARHMMLLGTSAFAGDFDPLAVRWSQSEDYTVWSPAVTNAAGGFRLNSGSQIVGAVKSKKEIVAFTDEGAHGIIYRGAPFFFTQERLGLGCGLVGPNAGLDLNGTVYWSGKSSLFKYDGTVQTIRTTLDKSIYDPDSAYSFNMDQKEKIVMGLNSEFNELWLFYPSVSSGENNRYFVYNYNTEEVFDGSLDRTTYVDAYLFDRPLATSTSNASFAHEITHDANGAELPAFLESGYFDIEDGQYLTFVDRIIPDVTNLTGNYMTAYIKLRKFPSETAKVKGPYIIGPGTKKIPLRGRARQIALRIEVSSVGSDFRLGRWRAGINPDGER